MPRRSSGGWALAFILSLLVTVVVMILQLRRPSYHGLGWQRINPGLPQWWQAWWQAQGHEIGHEINLDATSNHKQPGD